MNRFTCNFFQNGVQGGVTRFCLIYEKQRFQVRVDSRQEREFREYCTDDSAVQCPAGYLVKIAVLIVEEHQDKLFGQT